GIYLSDDQLIALAGEAEFTFQVGINAGDVMLVDIGAYFEASEYINLAEALAGVFTLSDFGVERGELPVYRRPKDEVAHLTAHQLQCRHAAGIQLLVLLKGLCAPN